MKPKNYLPRGDHELLTYTENYTTNLFPMLDRIGFPNDKYQELAALRNDFKTKLAAADNKATRTQVTVEAKTLAGERLKQALRQDTQEFVAHNSKVSDEDRTLLGVPIHDTHPTPVQPPTDVPTVTARPASNGGAIELLILNGEHRAKPPGVHGSEAGYGFFDTPPTNRDEFPHSAFTTTHTLTINLEGHSGKDLYFAVRWENTRGQKGPWCRIQHIIVP
jgi:hypothetical protein